MSTDTTLGIVGTALGIIGLISSYIFYRKSLRYKEPYFSIDGVTLIRDFVSKFDGLEVLYKGEKVENLSISNITIWNNGEETIHGSDITDTDPLRIICMDKDVKILSAKVLLSNNPASKAKCELAKDKSYIKVGFDYLDKDQGMIIQAVHTSSMPYILLPLGTIKGVKDIKYEGIDYNKAIPIPLVYNLPPPRRRVVSTIVF